LGDGIELYRINSELPGCADIDLAIIPYLREVLPTQASDVRVVKDAQETPGNPWEH